MTLRTALRFSPLSLALAGAFGALAPVNAQAANTDIANEPLTQAASGVRPNIMFILDDSGSMGWDFSPDYVDDVQPSGTTPNTTASCFDAGDPSQSSTNFSQDFDDSTGSISGRPDHCIPGDPPYMSADFNKQYYNPAIRYRPGVKSDGTDMTSMDKTATASWTAVPTDPYGQQQQNTLGVNATTANLVAGYPDRAWCQSNSDNPTSANCRVNSAYTYPDRTYNRGIGTATVWQGGNFSNVKYRNGSPYHYHMQTAQWCSTSNLAVGTCVSGTTVNPSSHKWIAPEFCTDPELVNCAAGQGLTAQHVFSGPRWCKDKTTLLDCQRKKVAGYIWPKHLGVTESRSATLTAASAVGTLTVLESAAGQQLTSLSVGTVSIIAAPVVAAGTSTSALAVQIRDAINGYTSTPNYTATASGSVVTITAATTGPGENGKAIVFASTQTGTLAAQATITVDNAGGNSQVVIDGITINHPSTGLTDLMSATCAGSYGFNVTATAGVITGTSGTNSPNERTSYAAAMASCINQATATHGFSATSSADTIIIKAPTSLGVTMNNRIPTVTKVSPDGAFSLSPFTGGGSSGVVVDSGGAMSGGSDATSGTVVLRLGTGYFSRIDIIPANNSYTRYPSRSDCAGTVCTYDEEMTNFANWYAYYRTRMQMMKTAAGRAFTPIDDTYRVGFITINPNSPVTASKYLRIQDYDPTHKDNWYTKFYGQSTNGGTPLREALSRVGRLYAGQFDKINSGIPSADDPVIVSCQPNFAILSTDGYWTTANSAWDGNDNIGRKVDNSAMTQQDNTNAGPYSLQSQGVWDGGNDSTVGLADVALYYYKTDLRAAGAKNAASGLDVSDDNVPTTDKDFAAHQHMTTFTLGLGLDGTLSYRSDYATATTGDFYAITQGTLSGSWPNPNSNSPESLDDLWHAAVNGRGVFFSASNPQELAASLTDTLNALKSRVGAGAAAATSNLQPVAGDNFAFTAQYQTQQWIGDVKARTIDLSSGAIAAVELWSAQALLNTRLHTDRTIYTLDTTDSYVSTSSGASGNQLKHFCDPAMAGLASWCNDGGGLTLLEMTYFKPSQLPQYSGYGAGQLVNATAGNLVNYLRGNQTFEDQGTATPTDLFRERTALLGDIINAQPAYVKAAPFDYNDTGYKDFKACSENVAKGGCPTTQFPPDASLSAPYPRRPTVFVSSNDGMLHAIETDVHNNPYYQTAGITTAATLDDAFSGGNNAGNGVERWAYIPGMLLKSIHKLASNPYVHRYFVDGSPVVGDICLSTPCAGLNDWRTILVGGLNSGGRGFYALDVTNPRNPRALWEFKVRQPSVTACAATTAAAIGATDDCDLGLSYGNPVISKVALWNGTAYEKRWVVMVTSGHNNTGVEPFTTLRQGDGGGYLYILDAVSGRILQKIATGVGDPGTSAASYTDADPSGLARVNNWVNDSLRDNTSLAVYAGDLKGNLWRFDLDNASSTYLKAVKVADLKDSGGVSQPVTTKPELGLINGRRVIFLGTGKFLGNSDKITSDVQTVYAISDDLAGNVTVTNRTPLVEQVITPDTSTTRTVTAAAKVDWTDPTMRGWFVDLPDKGERVSVDVQLQLGTLVVPSNVPSSDTCVAGGTGWINTFDFKTGSFVAGATANAVSQKVTGSVVVGINVIQLPGGKVVTVVTTADNQQRTVETPIAPTSFQGKRVGWRELNADQ